MTQPRIGDSVYFSHSIEVSTHDGKREMVRNPHHNGCGILCGVRKFMLGEIIYDTVQEEWFSERYVDKYFIGKKAVYAWIVRSNMLGPDIYVLHDDLRKEPPQVTTFIPFCGMPRIMDEYKEDENKKFVDIQRTQAYRSNTEFLHAVYGFPPPVFTEGNDSCTP